MSDGMSVTADGLTRLLAHDLACLRAQKPKAVWQIRMHPLDSALIVRSKGMDPLNWLTTMHGCKVVIDETVVRGDPLFAEADRKQ